MPKILSSSDLRNHYNDISNFCHQNNEPVFITKNGKEDLAIMSIELFEKLSGKAKLYKLLDEGTAAIKAGNKRSFVDSASEIRVELAQGNDKD